MCVSASWHLTTSARLRVQMDISDFELYTTEMGGVGYAAASQITEVQGGKSGRHPSRASISLCETARGSTKINEIFTHPQKAHANAHPPTRIFFVSLSFAKDKMSRWQLPRMGGGSAVLYNLSTAKALPQVTMSMAGNI